MMAMLVVIVVVVLMVMVFGLDGGLNDSVLIDSDVCHDDCHFHWQ